MHGEHGWGTRNTEVESLLEFAVYCNLVIGNTCFKKQPNHLITYNLGEERTGIDHMLSQKNFCTHMMDASVIPGEEFAKQHHLLVCDFRADIPPSDKKTIVPHLRIWQLRQPESQTEYQRLSLQRRPQAMLMPVGKYWSQVCCRQLKMCVRLPRNIGGEKRSDGGMQLSTVQSMIGRDAGKPGRKVAARKNIRKPNTSPNMLCIWRNLRPNKKFSRTLHPGAQTVSA